MNFNSPFQNQFTLNPQSQYVFVSDMFVEHYVGGAELTSEALIKSCPGNIEKVLAKQVTMELLEQGKDKYWIFGNFSSLNMDLIPTIVANLNYTILEYDYKYCKYRSPEKHKFSEQKECDCDADRHGKLISAFYFGAKNLFWMSESQMHFYLEKFPFLQDGEVFASSPRNTVLSSVFDDDFFVKVKELRHKNSDLQKKGWIVLGSNSWIKGADLAESWCKENKVDYEVVWNLPYFDLLEKLSRAEGFVYLPRGMDTCPRMVIEAKLLGCKLQLNEHVQHKDEEWFATQNIEEIEEYLYASRDLFWNMVSSSANHTPTVSGYTTTRNCIEQAYPYKECIQSMLNFCDEVVVVDGGSTDGTWEDLQRWSKEEPKLVVEQVVRDWNSKRHAVFDGLQKAEARKRCTKEFCWQMDADEVAPPTTGNKVQSFIKAWPKLADLVSLPVVEYWGSTEKVRIDVNPWKWRLSRNLPHITHGIPAELRKKDNDGELYSAPGTDGCDYVHAETYERIPHATFYSEDAHNARIAALQGNNQALQVYEQWMKNVVTVLPSVEHFSWMDIERKIKTYKNYWQRHWESLYDVKQEDTAENNMFFDKPWSQVTDEEISVLAKKLAAETGGHVFHTKVNWNYPTPHIKVSF